MRQILHYVKDFYCSLFNAYWILIKGLDPAQPAFDFATKDDRLDKEDADFVDVIHTNSGMIWEVNM